MCDFCRKQWIKSCPVSKKSAPYVLKFAHIFAERSLQCIAEAHCMHVCDCVYIHINWSYYKLWTSVCLLKSRNRKFKILFKIWSSEKQWHEGKGSLCHVVVGLWSSLSKRYICLWCSFQLSNGHFILEFINWRHQTDIAISYLIHLHVLLKKAMDPKKRESWNRHKMKNERMIFPGLLSVCVWWAFHSVFYSHNTWGHDNLYWTLESPTATHKIKLNWL